LPFFARRLCDSLCLRPTDATVPDGKIEVKIVARGPLTYAVNVDGRPVLTPSRLGLELRTKQHSGQTWS